MAISPRARSERRLLYIADDDIFLLQARPPFRRRCAVLITKPARENTLTFAFDYHAAACWRGYLPSMLREAKTGDKMHTSAKVERRDLTLCFLRRCRCHKGAEQ